MDMQYQYTEKYVKDIAEAIRFIAGSDDTYSIKEMPAAIAAASPPTLGKPEDLFANEFNAQLGTANQCFRWGIFSKYPDDSYIVTLDGYNRSGWTPSSSPVLYYGMKFNSDFTAFVPYYRFNASTSKIWNLFYTRQENSEATGVYLDSSNRPHIPKDLPYTFLTRSYDGMDYNGIFSDCLIGTDGYYKSDSISQYIRNEDAISGPVFNNRFKVFGASNLNGKVPSDLYSVISDGNWHNGVTIPQNIRTFINPVETPSGVTISGACIFNTIGYVDDVIQFKNYYSGPSWLYYRDANDHLRFNTTNKTFYNNNNNNLKAYFTHFRQTQDKLNGYGIYPWNDGMNKVTITLSSYEDRRPDMMQWTGSYDNPASVDDLKSYIPFRTYDILDQNGNVLLPANATLADFGIS